jgi:hypothetical protein
MRSLVRFGAQVSLLSRANLSQRDRGHFQQTVEPSCGLGRRGRLTRKYLRMYSLSVGASDWSQAVHWSIG